MSHVTVTCDRDSHTGPGDSHTGLRAVTAVPPKYIRSDIFHSKIIKNGMESNVTSSHRVNRATRSTRRQGVYWILTIPHAMFVPYLPPSVQWIRGQLEAGGDSGYLHWQICLGLRRKGSLSNIKETFGDSLHAELAYSAGAYDYVWKEDTAVPNTRFELGERLLNRSSSQDWDKIWDSACEGRLMEIPSDIRIRCYRTFRSIAADYSRPVGMERTCSVFWGKTGSGKSRRAWDEAGESAYTKDPRTKFWTGYQGEENVVIDEFRGGFDVAHLLRWLDRYPVNVEIKGASVPLCAKRFWITSNLHPGLWYPELDVETRDALLRRMTLVEFE